MSVSGIVWPCVAMVGLTAVVWLRLLIERVSEIRAKQLSVQAVATSSQVSGVLQNIQASDNFRNLFELPVLFYTLCVLLLVTGLATDFQVGAAWGFVGLRILHSVIHCTYNRVMHRFAAFVLSSLLLFVMWGVFVSALLNVL